MKKPEGISPHPSSPGNHSVNWFDRTADQLEAQFPAAFPREFTAEDRNATGLCERLSILLLQMLSQDCCKQLLELLPETVSESEVAELTVHCGFHKDREKHPVSHTVAEFTKVTQEYLRCSPELSTKVTDFYLWAVAQDIPTEIKGCMSQFLPEEFRSRMNVFTSPVDGSQVA